MPRWTDRRPRLPEPAGGGKTPTWRTRARRGACRGRGPCGRAGAGCGIGIGTWTCRGGRGSGGAGEATGAGAVVAGCRGA